jgi:protein-S-isoprenylcysteine O-methyltransferase Ste14
MTAPDSPRIFVPPPLMFAVAIALGVMIDGNVFERRHFTHLFQYSGALLALPGLLLILGALGLFRRAGTRPEPWEPSSALVMTGIYRFTRNPMYLGMALVAGGVGFYFESIVAGLLLAGVIALMDRVVIPREEDYLLRRFGAEYETYRSRVRRWL